MTMLSLKNVGKITGIVILITAILLSVAEKITAQEATSDSEVRERVRAKIKSLLTKPRAIVGTLSAITENSLQVESKTGDIMLASVSKETMYFRITKSKKTEIKFEELVLGEFVVIMGFEDENNVLSAARVIAYTTPPIVEKEAILGYIQSIAKDKIVLKQADKDTVWEVAVNKNTEITASGTKETKKIKLQELAPNNKIIVIGVIEEENKQKLDASRLHRLE